ncbi:MAG: hypothetical protein G01um101419_203 [Parcubacteria group bacterium Gr01-1014_19]|nr:MAG: hypothetical protein G01um101419_203 [Parcubacteria group bacterium Gr01-1014_19]
MLLMALMLALVYLVLGFIALCVACLIDARWMEMNKRGNCVFVALWPIFVLVVLDLAIRRFLHYLPDRIVDLGYWCTRHRVREGDLFTHIFLGGPRL